MTYTSTWFYAVHVALIVSPTILILIIAVIHTHVLKSHIVKTLTIGHANEQGNFAIHLAFLHNFDSFTN